MSSNRTVFSRLRDLTDECYFSDLTEAEISRYAAVVQEAMHHMPIYMLPRSDSEWQNLYLFGMDEKPVARITREISARVLEDTRIYRAVMKREHGTALAYVSRNVSDYNDYCMEIFHFTEDRDSRSRNIEFSAIKKALEDAQDCLSEIERHVGNTTSTTEKLVALMEDHSIVLRSAPQPGTNGSHIHWFEACYTANANLGAEVMRSRGVLLKQRSRFIYGTARRLLLDRKGLYYAAVAVHDVQTNAYAVSVDGVAAGTVFYPEGYQVLEDGTINSGYNLGTVESLHL